MKSSTLNPSLQQAVRNDPRVQAFLKQEMAEHQAIIASHHKEMQELRDLLSTAIERFESLYGSMEERLKQQSADLESLKAAIDEKTKNHEALLSGHRSSIIALSYTLDQFQQTHATRVDLEKVKSDVSSLVQSANAMHQSEFQAWQHGVNGTIKVFKDSMDNLRESLGQSMEAIHSKIDRNFSVSMIDKEGVSKEVRAYEKTIFIIEKKIEHIYIQIERMKKRGEACHKPE